MSGGHSLFFLVHSSTHFELLGSTIDDAAGEAFDKGGRLLGLPYPAGKLVDELSRGGDENRYSFPIGLKNSGDCRLSFSGLKTSLGQFLRQNPQFRESVERQRDSRPWPPQSLRDLLASYQWAIVQALELKLQCALKRAKEMAKNPQLPIVVGGGVACNHRLRQHLRQKFGPQLYFVPPRFCTDNGAMIAHLGLRNFPQRIPFPRCLAALDAQGKFISKALPRDRPQAVAPIRPNKKLGQHLLKTPHIIHTIVRDCPEDCRGIVEVGPGAGALTAPSPDCRCRWWGSSGTGAFKTPWPAG